MANSDAFVVDVGSFQVKAGISSAQRPQTLVDTPQQLTEDFWTGLFRQGASSGGEASPVVLGLNATTTRRVQEEHAQVIFEQFNVPALFAGSSPFLAVLGSGLSTALVVDIGEGGASVAAVEEGYRTPHCAANGGVGGALLNEVLASMFQKKPEWKVMETAHSQSVARTAKENLCYVAANYSNELRLSQQGDVAPRRFQLPGGPVLEATLGEGFRCAETLFDPSLSSQWLGGRKERYTGIHELVFTAARLQTDIALRGRLMGNILLVGGTSLIPGLTERLQEEVRRHSPWVAPGRKPEDVIVHAPAQRCEVVWRGGADLAKCDILRQLWTTRADYEESGAVVVRRRFV